MKVIRLYVLQDNRRWCEDIAYGQHLERIADLEITGATIYHASLLPSATKRKSPTTPARLRQRL